MNTQVIVTPSGERLVVMPEEEYRLLLEAAEDAADAEAIRRFEEALAAGEEELIPADVVNRLLDGENKVRVWREFRGITVPDAAARAGISETQLAESRKGRGSPTSKLSRRSLRSSESSRKTFCRDQTTAKRSNPLPSCPANRLR